MSRKVWKGVETKTGEVKIAKRKRKREKEKKKEKTKKEKIIEVKKVVEKWEIWNEEEKAAKFKKETKKLAS